MGYALAFRPRRGALAAAVALTLAACSSGSTEPVTGPLTRQGEAVEASLRQNVEVGIKGDTVTINSVVRNVGTAPVSVETRICGLDVDPSIAWADDVRCGGYSMTTSLAPNETITATDRRRLVGAPESVRVRHLLSPEVWVTVPLR